MKIKTKTKFAEILGKSLSLPGTPNTRASLWDSLAPHNSILTSADIIEVDELELAVHKQSSPEIVFLLDNIVQNCSYYQ